MRKDEIEDRQNFLAKAYGALLALLVLVGGSAWTWNTIHDKHEAQVQAAFDASHQPITPKSYVIARSAHEGGVAWVLTDKTTRENCEGLRFVKTAASYEAICQPWEKVWIYDVGYVSLGQYDM